MPVTIEVAPDDCASSTRIGQSDRRRYIDKFAVVIAIKTIGLAVVGELHKPIELWSF